MSELQAYYEAFCTGYWAHPDTDCCPCHGNGWALSDVDTWHKCPIHFNGQMHPEDVEYLLDAGIDPDTYVPPAPAPEPLPLDDFPYDAGDPNDIPF